MEYVPQIGIEFLASSWQCLMPACVRFQYYEQIWKLVFQQKHLILLSSLNPVSLRVARFLQSSMPASLVLLLFSTLSFSKIFQVFSKNEPCFSIHLSINNHPDLLGGNPDQKSQVHQNTKSRESGIKRSIQRVFF